MLKLLLFLVFAAAMIGLGAFGTLYREGLKADFMALKADFLTMFAPPPNPKITLGSRERQRQLLR